MSLTNLQRILNFYPLINLASNELFLEIKGLKIIFEYEIYSGKDLAITGTATVLAYNYEEQKIKKIPANFKELIEKYSIKKAIAN